MEIEEWLNQPPLPEEIKTKDGAKYIPYAVILEKLNQLSPHCWSAYNFRETYVVIGRRLLVTGSIDIEVNYELSLKPPFQGTQKITRRLSGAANFIVNKASNPHPTATVKSLAIMNAVKPLGKQFGWNLNPENEEEKTAFLPVVKVEKDSPDAEKQRLLDLINDCTTQDEVNSYQILAKQRGLVKEWDKKHKSLTIKP
jgi:hypothetical protein